MAKEDGAVNSEDSERLGRLEFSNKKLSVFDLNDLLKASAEVLGGWNFSTFWNGCQKALSVLSDNSPQNCFLSPNANNSPSHYCPATKESWWGHVEKSWGILQKYHEALPFYTNFDQGRGYHISVHGNKVSDATWCNISSQGIQPPLEFADSTANSIQILVDLKEASYGGGGNSTFKGSLEEDNYFERRIFQGEFIWSKLPIHFIYSVKSDSNLSLGLVVEFASTVNKRKGRDCDFI